MIEEYSYWTCPECKTVYTQPKRWSACHCACRGKHMLIQCERQQENKDEEIKMKEEFEIKSERFGESTRYTIVHETIGELFRTYDHREAKMFIAELKMRLLRNNT